MTDHPIQNIMFTAMNSIKEMVDVNTIVGDAIECASGTVIIPISKVSFGFASGGSEFKGETIDEYNKRDKDEQIQYRLPFGGGAGAGVSVNPIAFLVVRTNSVKLLPVDYSNAIDKILDYMPDLIEKANEIFDRFIQNKKELGDKIVNDIRKKCEEKNKDDSKKNDEPKIKEVNIDFVGTDVPGDP